MGHVVFIQGEGINFFIISCIASQIGLKPPLTTFRLVDFFSKDKWREEGVSIRDGATEFFDL